MTPTRIAIVGFGPRGLGALERLIAHQRMPASTPVEVTIFEPHAIAGAGSAYAPHQPPFLLMNFPAAKIDLNWNTGRPPSALDCGSFDEWFGSETEPDRTGHFYPSRALVGRYLAAAAAELIDASPFPVELVPESVLAMQSVPEGWQVQSGTRTGRFDEVLLAVGHAPRPSPVTASPDGAEAGSVVSIKGFGLTAIDLILELTEGRGGRFEPTERSSLRYIASGDEPSAILPRSRHGRPMLVKPELARSPAPQQALKAAILESRREVLQMPPESGVDQLCAVIASLSSDLLSLDGDGGWAAAENWTSSACSGLLEPAADPTSAIARSLRIANGQVAPDLNWALGLAWRSIYPAIVGRYSHGGLPESGYVPFRMLAAELERLAFGPPPVNGAKLLALVEAGILDPGETGGALSGRARIELDAVTEPPGLVLHQTPLADLVGEGAIRTPTGSRGIEVTRSARCVGADGEITPGLAACGRLTEDWIIGNDTLDRSLHPEVDRWAAAVSSKKESESRVAVAS